jgi:hypothetical protein
MIPLGFILKSVKIHFYQIGLGSTGGGCTGGACLLFFEGGAAWYLKEDYSRLRPAAKNF